MVVAEAVVTVEVEAMVVEVEVVDTTEEAVAGVATSATATPATAAPTATNAHAKTTVTAVVAAAATTSATSGSRPVPAGLARTAGSRTTCSLVADVEMVTEATVAGKSGRARHLHRRMEEDVVVMAAAVDVVVAMATEAVATVEAVSKALLS